MNTLQKTSTIDQLAKVFNHFGKDQLQEKADLLLNNIAIDLNNVKQIKQYHDILLFLISYPDNSQIYLLARDEMKNLAGTVRGLAPEKKELLTNSGIVFTETQGTFSFAIMKFLVENFPEEASIHSFDNTGAHPKVLLKHVVNDMEFELLGDDNSSKLKWLEKASGFKKKHYILKWLLTAVDELPLEQALKEDLFESLKLFISIKPVINKPNSFWFSRAFGGVDTDGIYFHKEGLLKKFDEQALINKKLPTEKKINTDQKEEILEAARIALILLNRETEPITNSTVQGMKVFDLEHGLSIALFSIKPQMRLALESYIGFMMFKNGSPMAYGGAWLFGQRSLIGINIFEAFRGGESAYVFAQLLRTYKQAFGAQHFEVEPYQFGKNNPEGLKSGAFWFYHRFGFRPVDQKLRELADEEHQKIMQTKGYRSPIAILKQFTNSNLEVDFGKVNKVTPPSKISHFISENIARQFKGSRQSAFKWSQGVLKTELGLTYSELSKTEQIGFAKLGIFAALCLKLKKMTATDKKTLIKLIKEKGSSEFDYILTVHKFPFEKYYVEELVC